MQLELARLSMPVALTAAMTRPFTIGTQLLSYLPLQRGLYALEHLYPSLDELLAVAALVLAQLLLHAHQDPGGANEIHG